MKKRILLFSAALLVSFFYANAQSGFGIKGGISYNSNGKFTQIISDTQTNLIDNKGAGKSGFNIGFYDKINLGPIYLRPELSYTRTTSQYTLNSQNENYNLSKLDLPILLGIKVIGPLNIFAGPAFQFILSNDFKNLTYQNVKNDVTMGLNLGVALELGRLGFDVRYERGLNANEAKFVQVNLGNSVNYTLDTRPEQIIFGVSYRLSNK